MVEARGENQIFLSVTWAVLFCLVLLVISCMKRTKEVLNVMKNEVLEAVLNFIYHSLSSMTVTELASRCRLVF